MEEKRRFRRVNASFIVRFRIPKSHLGMSSRSEDISEVGMRLAAMQRLRPGMVLELNFSLQESTDPIKTRAKIVWQDSRKNVYFPFSLGMEFIEITPIDRNQIKNYISKALQESKSIATPTLHH